jgi:hypothetical protein
MLALWLFTPSGLRPEMDYRRIIALGVLRMKAGEGSKFAMQTLVAFGSSSESLELAELAQDYAAQVSAAYALAVVPRLKYSLAGSGVIASMALIAGILLTLGYGLQGGLVAGVVVFGSLGVFLSCAAQLKLIRRVETEHGHKTETRAP